MIGSGISQLDGANATPKTVILFLNNLKHGVELSAVLSTNIINGLAVVGILSHALILTLATNSLALGLVSGLITFAITFPMAQQILPFFINQVDELRYTLFKDGVYFPNNWHKYFTGIIFSIFLLGVQYVMLVGFTKFILSGGIKSI